MSRKLKGKGRGVTFLREHANYASDECLPWPMNRVGGYGMFGLNGKLIYAHRFMCELAHGPAPSPKHQVAHSCGKGHDGCVNPRHLSWKTVSENMLDKRVHGTMIANPFGNLGGLSPEQIAAMRALKGTMSEAKIAEKFGVKRGCVQYWFRTDRVPARLRGVQRRIRTHCPHGHALTEDNIYLHGGVRKCRTCGQKRSRDRHRRLREKRRAA